MSGDLPEPIRSEWQAQSYGSNVHSIANARARVFDATVLAIHARQRRPTLAKIMDGPGTWPPGGGAAA